MDIKSQYKFRLYLEKKNLSAKIAQDNNSRLKRLESMLNLDLDLISAENFDLNEISRKLAELLYKNNKSSKYVHSSKGGMLSALRHFIRFKFKTKSNKMLPKLTPLRLIKK